MTKELDDTTGFLEFERMIMPVIKTHDQCLAEEIECEFFTSNKNVLKDACFGTGHYLCKECCTHFIKKEDEEND